MLNKILTRYSLGGKYLSEPGPNPEEIALILKAAQRSPDHANLRPYYFYFIQGDSRNKLAELFTSYAMRSGVSDESIALERGRALSIPLTIVVVARIDMNHPIASVHEQWITVGGAITNILNAIHILGYAGKMLSGNKVRDAQIIKAFCHPGETLVGWIVVGTPTKRLKEKISQNVEEIVRSFD